MRAREFMPVAEAGTIKPEGPLNADEWRKRSAKQARTQQQVKDEAQRHAAKERDLKARLP
jgi:hypothetical protein